MFNDISSRTLFGSFDRSLVRSYAPHTPDKRDNGIIDALLCPETMAGRNSACILQTKTGWREHIFDNLSNTNMLHEWTNEWMNENNYQVSFSSSISELWLICCWLIGKNMRISNGGGELFFFKRECKHELSKKTYRGNRISQYEQERNSMISMLAPETRHCRRWFDLIVIS